MELPRLLQQQHSHLTRCSGAMYWSSRASITKYYRLGDLNNRNFSVSVLEARYLRSKSQQGWFLGLWLYNPSDFRLHCPHDIVPMCMSFNVQISPSKSIIGLGPTLMT